VSYRTGHEPSSEQADGWMEVGTAEMLGWAGTGRKTFKE